MRDLNTFLADYGDSHRNPVNQWVHILCVPAIFVSTLGLFWLIPLGHWLGLDGSLAYWVNGGTLLAAICMPFYLRMSVGMTALMGVWLALSLAAVVAGLGRTSVGPQGRGQKTVLCGRSGVPAGRAHVRQHRAGPQAGAAPLRCGELILH